MIWRGLRALSMMRFCAWAVTLPFASAVLAEDLALQSPVDCTLGDTCYIQQYMDRDPGEGFSDFRCSSLSYDGHKGTDFAVPTLADMEAGVRVLAAADGRVRGLRDGMPDTGFSKETEAAVNGKECGNGVVLVHPGGWETQYCHLKNGSVSVRNNQPVKAGDVLGLIGQSGRAEFPHLHLSVRQGGNPVDPFDTEGSVTCGAPSRKSLWSNTPIYQPGGVVDIGISDAIPAYEDVKLATVSAATLPVSAPAIIVYGLTFGTQKDDVLRLEISGPQGKVISKDTVLERNHARAYRAVGQRRKRSSSWPSGTYVGTATLLRNGKVISSLQSEVQVE